MALLLAGLPSTLSKGRAPEGGGFDDPTGASSGAGRSANRFVPSRILLKFRASTSDEHPRRLLAAYGARTGFPGIDVHVVELPATAIEEHFVQTIQAFPEVEFAELDRILQPAVMNPNDPRYGSEWLDPDTCLIISRL
ncbi:MAG TPA: hypothetical protein VF240_09725 [Pyrinomonadaceae bacterium]